MTPTNPILIGHLLQPRVQIVFGSIEFPQNVNISIGPSQKRATLMAARLLLKIKAALE